MTKDISSEISSPPNVFKWRNRHTVNFSHYDAYLTLTHWKLWTKIAMLQSWLEQKLSPSPSQKLPGLV